MEHPVDIFAAELDADTEDMLRLVAQAVEDLGYVKPGYAEALLERERAYPTGLAMDHGTNVAIPHADIEYTLRPAVVIIERPAGSFEFRRMDEPDQLIPVSAAFLLVLKDPEGYMGFLAGLADLFQQDSFIRTMQAARAAGLAVSLQDTLDEYNLRYTGQLQLPAER